LDETEANASVLQEECQDLAAQVIYLQTKLQEMEDTAKITSMRQRIDVRQNMQHSHV